MVLNRVEQDVSVRGWTSTSRGSGLVLVASLLISGCVFAFLAWLQFDRDFRAYQLLDDVTSYAGVKWYTGSIAALVQLLWCSSAAICGFAGWTLRDRKNRASNELSRFFLVFCAVNLWFTLDDLFMVHEQTARLIAGRGAQDAAEGVIFALYAVLLAGLFWHYRHVILRTEYLLLAAAAISLLASAAVDVAFQVELNNNNPFREAFLSVSWGPPVSDMLEDTLKLNGGILWLVYFARTAGAAVRSNVALA